MSGNEELRKNLLILAVVIVIVGIFYVLSSNFGSKVPQLEDSEMADIRGLLNEWEKRGHGIFAYVETVSGKFKEYNLLIDEKTRAYHADQGEASRSLEVATVADVDEGQFVEIYFRRPTPGSGPKTVDTIVYWE